MHFHHSCQVDFFLTPGKCGREQLPSFIYLASYQIEILYQMHNLCCSHNRNTGRKKSILSYLFSHLRKVITVSILCFALFGLCQIPAFLRSYLTLQSLLNMRKQKKNHPDGNAIAAGLINCGASKITKKK